MAWFEVDIEQIDRYKVRLEAETIDEARNIAMLIDLSEGVPARSRNVAARYITEKELASNGDV